MDGKDGYPGGVKYRAFYAANKQCSTLSCPETFAEGAVKDGHCEKSALFRHLPATLERLALWGLGWAGLVSSACCASHLMPAVAPPPPHSHTHYKPRTLYTPILCLSAH